MASPAPPSPCPICATPAPLRYTVPAFGTDWRIHACPACRHGFVANRPTLTDLNAFYQSQPEQLGGDTPSAVLPRPAAEFARLVAHLTPLRGRSLDVGCGGGDFSIALQRLGFTPTLNDWSPAVAKLLPHFPGGRAYVGAFEDLPDPGPYDAIVMSQVLEHALDPLDWLRRCAKLLSPGGVVGVALPNFHGVYRLLGRRDPFLIPPFHLNYFSGDSLRRAFAAAGLTPLLINSTSELRTHAEHGPRLAARRAINVLTRPLDHTPYGIILRGFARRD